MTSGGRGIKKGKNCILITTRFTTIEIIYFHFWSKHTRLNGLFVMIIFMSAVALLVLIAEVIVSKCCPSRMDDIVMGSISKRHSVILLKCAQVICGLILLTS
jgi:hypothetical protein